MRYFRFTLTGLTATALLLGCGESTTPVQTSRPAVPDPSFTVAVGLTSTPVARGNAGVFDVNSNVNGYNVQVKATSNTDIAVSTLAIVPGGNSGWHSHLGPVIVVVKTGAITFYRSAGPGTCSHITYHAGAAFVETGGEVVSCGKHWKYRRDGGRHLLRSGGRVRAYRSTCTRGALPSLIRPTFCCILLWRL